MIVEYFNVYEGEDIKWYYLILVAFYIGVTLYVAYKYPIKFPKLINKLLSTKLKLQNTTNHIINFILAFFFSVVFWVIKIIEIVVMSKTPKIKNNKKKRTISKKSYYDPIY